MGVSLYPDWAADSFWRVLRREIKLEPLGRKRPGSTEARSTSSLARRALMRSRGVSACPARARPSRFVLLAGPGRPLLPGHAVPHCQIQADAAFSFVI